MVTLRILLALIISETMVASYDAAHPIHTTFTEIVQPASRGAVTITIRGFEDDLTAAARAGTSITHVDCAIIIYIRRQARLTDLNGRDIPLRGVGLRRSAGVVWVTLRTLGAVDLAGSRFINRALTEVFHDQVNLVQVKMGGRNRTIMFTPGDGSKAIAS